MQPSNLPDPPDESSRAESTPAPIPPHRILARGIDAGFVPAPAPEAPPTLIDELRLWPAPESRRPAFSPPVFGALSVIFGVTAFYKATLLLAPLALVAALFACLKRQWGWGLIGALSAVAALAIDPYFWGLAGLYWLARALGLIG